MFNVDFKRVYKSELRLILFTLAIIAATLWTLTGQTSLAAVINCPDIKRLYHSRFLDRFCGLWIGHGLRL